MPGVGVSLDALSTNTAQLPAIDIAQAGSVIGTNSADSMRSGIIYGTAAMIDGCWSVTGDSGRGRGSRRHGRVCREHHPLLQGHDTGRPAADSRRPVLDLQKKTVEAGYE